MMQAWFESMNARWLILLIGGLVGIALLGIWLRRRREAAWRRVARRLRLKSRQTDTGPVVQGRHSGHRLLLRLAPDSSDTGAGVVVGEFSVDVPEAPTGMIARAVPGVMGDIAGLAEQRLLLGDDQFDSNTHVSGEPEQAIRQFWTPHRREKFLGLLGTIPFDRLLLEEGLLKVERRGVLDDPDALEQELLQLLAAAQVLSASSAGLPDPASSHGQM
jgi:hypothetical protein